MSLHPYIKHPRATAQPQPWSIPNLCAAYDWPKNQAGGSVIAIIELGGGWTTSDMQQFFSSIGQPMPTIFDISASEGIGNTQQNPPNDADYEVALDIQVAAAAYYLATGKPATIHVYWANDIATGVNKAVADGCVVCSISWGADEANWGADAAGVMELAARAANSAGMSIFAAAGDNDSSDGGPNPANVDLPASCPHVVSCGGTSKTPTSETVWNNNPDDADGSGTGGGFSSYWLMQAFQETPEANPTGAPKLRPGRMVPDCAANADPDTGYEIVVYGQVQVVGGTSAVAPLYAGLFASFGKRLGWINPLIWASQSAFNDITEGNNGMFDAQVGPDPCTGVGSPKGSAIAALVG